MHGASDSKHEYKHMGGTMQVHVHIDYVILKQLFKRHRALDTGIKCSV